MIENQDYTISLTRITLIIQYEMLLEEYRHLIIDPKRVKIQSENPFCTD